MREPTDHFRWVVYDGRTYIDARDVLSLLRWLGQGKAAAMVAEALVRGVEFKE